MEDGEYGEFVELMFRVYGSLHDRIFGAESGCGGLAWHETRILGCLGYFGRLSPSKLADLLGLSGRR